MAWDFDGTDDYMEVAHGVNYDVPKTLACWFNSDTTNAAKTLIALSTGAVGANESPALILSITNAAQVRAATAATNGNNNSITTDTYGLQTWHHAAARFAGSASRIAYLDGVPGTENTNNRATGGSLDNLTIGRGSGGTYNPSAPFNGRMAEVAVWDVALDAAEIAALAKGYRPSLIRPDKLLFYLPLVREVIDPRSGLSFTNNATAVAIHPRRVG